MTNSDSVNAHVPGAATEILPADDGCLPADENLRSVRCEKRAGWMEESMV